MVVFDANFLLFLLQDNLPAPKIPGTDDLVTDCEARIKYLVDRLQKDREKIIIPTPALSEALVRTGAAAQNYVAKINKSAAFKIEPFDQRAAIEVALMTGEAIKAGDKKAGSPDTWAKVKYDRQILAIAIVNSVTTIYAYDENLKKLAEKKGIKIIGVHELELPPEDAQFSLGLDNEDEKSEDTEPKE